MIVRVVGGEALHPPFAQAVHAAVADVQHVRLAPAQQQRAEGGGHAAQVGVLSGKAVQPAVHGL
jgi:hypothetical protein